MNQVEVFVYAWHLGGLRCVSLESLSKTVTCQVLSQKEIHKNSEDELKGLTLNLLTSFISAQSHSVHKRKRDKYMCPKHEFRPD